jgi:hypothetical protein
VAEVRKAQFLLSFSALMLYGAQSLNCRIEKGYLNEFLEIITILFSHNCVPDLILYYFRDYGDLPGYNLWELKLRRNKFRGLVW